MENHVTNSELYLKALIKAEVKKMLKEGVVATPSVIRTNPNLGKYKLREEEQVDPKIEDELEKALGDAAKKFATDMSKVGKDAQTKLQDEDEVEKVLKQNPEIEKLAKESVARRGKQLTERGQLNEELLSVSFLVGLALAIPSIVSLIGSLVKVIEGKLGSKTEMGDKLKHIGHEMHEGIIKYITNGLKLIPGFSKLKPETQKKISTVVHVVIVAYLAIHSGGVAIESVKSGLEAANISTAAVEGALAAVKTGEVASFLKKSILAAVGA